MIKKLFLSVFFYFFFFLFILGCSSTSNLDKTNRLYKQITASGNLQIKIPNNWIEIKDNHNQLFDIWLVNKKNDASIVFIPIYISEEIVFNNELDKLDTIKEIVLAKKKATSTNFAILEKTNLNNNFISQSIRYLIEGKEYNSIIFGKNNVFYESQAYIKSGNQPSSLSLNDLIEVQEHILKNAKIK